MQDGILLKLENLFESGMMLLIIQMFFKNIYDFDLKKEVQMLIE
jgi:hypothetical protein